MKRLDKRIKELENRATQEDYDGAWIAIIQNDDTVNLSHEKHGKLELPTREAFQVWQENNIIDDDRIRLFIVDVLNCQGEEPKEL